MLEKLKKVLDNGESCGAHLVDLSKSFNCIVHYLLLEKLSVYGFDYNSLELINSFLSGRKHRTKIGPSYSSYLDLLVDVPQGSILGPLLFNNIYMCNLFLCNCETLIFNIINYADDTIPFMLANQIWTLYWVNLKKTPLQFLNGFKRTI